VVDTSIVPRNVFASTPNGPAPSGPHCLDCGDWIVVAFLFLFATGAFAYLFKHPSDVGITAVCGTLATFGCVFHWLRVKDQKVADA
jgi:hypothetical protein